jgi:predicted anti-sigma-YlaC factor YlaD
MRLADDLACTEFVELVTEYWEGALAERDRERFEEHLAFCDWCRIYLSQMQTTLRVSGRLYENDLDPETADHLLEVFRDWKQE